MLIGSQLWCQLKGKVVSVLDGDTFILLTSSKEQVRIRLHGIDCPEKDQPFGQAAKKFASDQIFGITVSVDSMDTDRYGRTIGMVWYDDHKNLNEERLKAGLAWHYKHYDNNPKWAQMETEARTAKRGLWQDSNAMPPWEWRHQKNFYMARLEWQKLLSGERFRAKKYPDDNDYDVRTEYQRDIDRIIYSSAFRRLQDKTQVMPLAQSDYVRTRLTHTLEVSSVGRSLGKLVGNFVLNSEPTLKDQYTPDDFANIVVAACLAHDIGNPPFGHFGEYSIGQFFSQLQESNSKFQLAPEQWEDLKQYEGNAEGLRILTSHESSGISGGMRLTYATLGAFTKYPCTSIRKDLTPFAEEYYLDTNENGEMVFRKTLKKVGVFQSERDTFTDIAQRQGLIKLTQDGATSLAWCRNPLAFIMEAADTITYHIIDLEDGYKMGIVSYEEAETLFYSILENTHDPRCGKDDWRKISDKDDRIGALRSKALNSLIHECFKVFTTNYDDIMEGKFDAELPDLAKSASILKKIKEDFTNARIFSHSSVIDVEIAGHKIIKTLLEAFVNATCIPNDAYAKRILAKMPEQYANILRGDSSDYNKLLACANYVSRMTDSFALQQYRIISGDGV